jgi:hypothetical protein
LKVKNQKKGEKINFHFKTTKKNTPPPPPHSTCKKQGREKPNPAEKPRFFTILSLITFFSRLLSSIKPQNRKHRLSVAETFNLYHRSGGVNKEVNYGY